MTSLAAYEEIGAKNRDMVMWIAADLVTDAERLFRAVAAKVLEREAALKSPEVQR
jgi:hypothetical protein